MLAAVSVAWPMPTRLPSGRALRQLQDDVGAPTDIAAATAGAMPTTDTMPAAAASGAPVTPEPTSDFPRLATATVAVTAAAAADQQQHNVTTELAPAAAAATATPAFDYADWA